MSDDKALAVALGLAKSWWRSKILWFNAVAAALLALEGVTGIIQPYVPVNVYVVFAVALPVINALLRVITTQALVMGADDGR